MVRSKKIEIIKNEIIRLEAEQKSLSYKKKKIKSPLTPLLELSIELNESVIQCQIENYKDWLKDLNRTKNE